MEGVIDMVSLNLDLTQEDVNKAAQFFANQGKTLEEGVKNIMLFVVSSYDEDDLFNIPDDVPTARLKTKKSGVFGFASDTPAGVKNHIRDLLEDD